MIKKQDEILQELLDLKKNGYPKGYNVGFEEFDQKIKFIRGGCTDITGYPFGGKSLLLKEILVSLTFNHKWKHAIYMPDDGTDVEIISNLIHKMYGKTFAPGYYNTISEKEIYSFINEVCHNFIFAKGQIEPKEFWAFAKENKCNSAAIDSWNYLAHKGNATDPEYLRQILSYRNTFMQNNKMHSFIIVHPKNPDPTQVKEGTVKKPTVYHIMGGSEWNNNGRNIMVVHKTDKSNYNEPYLVSVDKIKPKYAGEIGEFYLHMDWPRQKFFVMDNMQQNKVFAYGEEKKEQVKDPMLDFNPIITDDEPF